MRRVVLVLICTVSSALGDCWWTGCQLDSWAVKGCDQYGRSTQGTQSCSGGQLYNCCSQDAPTTAAPSGEGDCWWTGCQLDSWAVKGCDQYGRSTQGTQSCSGGKLYNCCSKNAPVTSAPVTAAPSGGSMPTWTEFSNAVTYNGYPAPSQTQFNNFVNNGPSRGQISSKQEAAMALAQFLHESDGLRAMREYACASSNCPNSYRTSGCDAPGQYYYGRGYIQLSWCGYNYRPASQDLYGDDRLVRDPDMVARDDNVAWATSFWFWSKNVHNANGVQQGKFGASTKAINGALECSSPGNAQAAVRFQLYGKVRQAFGLSGPGDSSGCA